MTQKSLRSPAIIQTNRRARVFGARSSWKLRAFASGNLCFDSFSELDLKLSGHTKIWYLLPSIYPTRMPDIPWNEAAKTQFARPRDRFESDLTDEEWSWVEPCLPPLTKSRSPRKTNLREVVNAIHYMLDTGCQWPAIPRCFPTSATVQNYSYAWSNNGFIDQLMDKLRALGRELAGRFPTATAIDTQSVKMTESSGIAGYDAGKQVKERKRHLVVDVEGVPDQDRRPRGIGAGSGWGSGRDPWHAGENAACMETLSGRRISRIETGVRAKRSRTRAQPWNR